MKLIFKDHNTTTMLRLQKGKYSSWYEKFKITRKFVNVWHGFIFVQAGWRSIVGYVRQPDRAKMESCRIFTQKGFSLLELMLTLCIIGLLFTVILPRLHAGANNAKLNLARQHATEIAIALVNWVHTQSEQDEIDRNHPFGANLMAEKEPLVGHYTGNKLFSGVEKKMHSAAPVNPFNKKSYFSKENDDDLPAPSNAPGLIYLASTLYTLPTVKDHKSTYRYYCLLISRGNQQWFDNMDHRTVTGVRNGVYVAQERQ